MTVDELIDTSESCSGTAKKAASLEVPGVQSDDVGETSSMGANKRCESCNSSDCGRVVHVEKCFRFKLLDYKDRFEYRV
jgi:hypothetical protein